MGCWWQLRHAIRLEWFKPHGPCLIWQKTKDNRVPLKNAALMLIAVLRPHVCYRRLALARVCRETQAKQCSGNLQVFHSGRWLWTQFSWCLILTGRLSCGNDARLRSWMRLRKPGFKNLRQLKKLGDSPNPWFSSFPNPRFPNPLLPVS